ncbi:MAG: SIMPL domain-containing protein [Balneolaceae bacterium]
MRQLFILPLLIFGIGCTTQAQQLISNQAKISLNMTATELVEADLIIFNININAESDTPRNAFKLHKSREAVLAELLKKFDIKEEHIRFEPIRINKRYTNNGKSQISQTNQQVSVTFSDFDIYEDIQLTLIENNFDNFNGSFSSTKLNEGKEKALLLAIKNVKEKAQLIAKASDVTLGDIVQITYSDYTITPSRNYARSEMMTMDATSTMMDFAQTISVTANISMDFSIE